jgi:hypothetical protein
MSSAWGKYHKQKLVGMRILGQKYELIPLVGLISCCVAGGVGFTIYAAYQKTDVRLNKYKRVEPPWEEVNPEERQKLVTYNQTYNKIPDLEKIRSEIGSYKH